MQKECSGDEASRDPDPRSEIDALRKHLRVALDALAASDRALAASNRDQNQLRSLLMTKDAEIASKDTEIAIKNAEIAELRRELAGPKDNDVSAQLTDLPSLAASTSCSSDSTTLRLPAESPKGVADNVCEGSEAGGSDGAHLTGDKVYVALDLPAGHAAVEGPINLSLPHHTAAAATPAPVVACPPEATHAAPHAAPYECKPAFSRPAAPTAAAAELGSPPRFRLRAVFASPLAACYSGDNRQGAVAPLDFLAEERLLMQAITEEQVCEG